MFGEPMVFTLGIMTLWTLTGLVHSTKISAVGFAITGYSSILLWRNMPGRLMGAVQQNHTLMHHRNIKVMDIYGARLILEGMGASMSFMILTMVFFYIGALKLPVDLFEVIIGWLLLAWLGASLAIVVGSLNERYEIVHTIWHPMAYLLIPLSGAMYTVSALPPKFQKVVLYVPMVNGVEIVREGFFGPSIHSQYNIPYLSTWCLVLSLIGLVQMTIIGRKIVM